MRGIQTTLVALGLLVGAVVLLPAVGLAAPFLATAWLVRALAGKQSGPSAHLEWRQLVQYEPEIGWRPRPNMDVYGRADDAFRLTTGADGWRGTGSVTDADMVVFGDSFAFGHGAEDDDMFINHCPGLRVKPIGSDGYSMVHGLLWMRRLAPDLGGKLVVWFIYLGNDLHEALLPNMGRYRMPFVKERNGAWEIVTDHVSPEPWPFPSSHSYYEWLADLCCPTPTSARVLGAADYLIQQARETCAGAGAHLAVVSVPMRAQLSPHGHGKLRAVAPDRAAFDVNRPDANLRESCERLDVPFLALKEHLAPRHYLLKDIHWTPEGHRRVGKILTGIYHQHTHNTAV